jgi:hypothetical protein
LTNITKVSLFKNHYVLYFLKGWWNAEYKEPTTKNDLGVDAVSRDKVKSYIQAHIHEIITESVEDKNKHTNRVLRSLIHGVDCMPSVAPHELRKGHWVHGEYCSECGCDVPAYIIDWKWQKDMDAKYCPNCGARMEEVKE